MYEQRQLTDSIDLSDYKFSEYDQLCTAGHLHDEASEMLQVITTAKNAIEMFSIASPTVGEEVVAAFKNVDSLDSDLYADCIISLGYSEQNVSPLRKAPSITVSELFDAYHDPNNKEVLEKLQTLSKLLTRTLNTTRQRLDELGHLLSE